MTAIVASRRSAFGRLVRTEAVLFGRSAGMVLWTAVLPLIALIVIGSVHSLRRPSASLHGISYLDAYLPILMIFSLCMAAVNLLPPTLALYRERGILRRLSTTPVPPSRLLAAQALIYLTVALVVAVLMLVIAVAAYGVPLPHQLPGFVLSLLLIAAATTGIGLLIAALAPSAKAGNAMSFIAFFPLMFFAGLWIPRATMPHALRVVSDYTPLGAGVRTVQASIAGHWPPTAGLLVLLGWAVVACLLAARTFRWQ